MAYGETIYGRAEEPAGPAAYRASSLAEVERRRVEAAEGAAADAEPAFDDNGRDRLGIHLALEAVLLVAAAVFAFLLYRVDADNLQRPGLDKLLVTGAAIGLLTLGAGLTLRAAVPNLALGPIALAAALHYAEQGDQGLLRAGVPALIVAAAGALVVGLVVLVLHVPGWIATLAAGLGVVVYNQLRLGPVTVQGQYDPTRQAFFLFGGFALLAVLGAALGTIGPIRRWLGRLRPVGDPAQRRGAASAAPVLISLVVSSVFAVGAGVLMSAVSAGPIVPGTGLEWTAVALGLAMLAGTSAFGRRGGIFGTLFAVIAMTAYLEWSGQEELNISLFATGAAVLGGGLLVTRLVEAFGRPGLPAAAEDWSVTPVAGTGNWTPDLENWTPPAASNATNPNGWDSGPWGSNR
jgi:hypothetical protein